MRSFETHVSEDSEYYVYTPSTLAADIFFYPLCVGHFCYEPGYSLKRNSYDSFLIMLITEGSCTVTINQTSLNAQKGTAVLLDCYAPHQYESSTGWESLWLHFDGPLCRKYYHQIVSAFGNVLMPRNVQIVEHALSKICKIFGSSSPIIEAEISRYITNILTELLLCQTEKETAPKTRLSLSDTIAYINEHFSEQITLDDLAIRASLSPYYFTRVFMKETGMTPHRYLIAARMNSAKFLLKTTDLSIKEIGFSSGFNSESSFCTAFRKYESITPGEYRSVDSI